MDMQYYQTTGTWYLTQFKGSWMMRPVFGACQDFMSGVNEKMPEVETAFYPNPASDIITFKANSSAVYEAKVFDARGLLVLQKNISNGNEIDLKGLSEGIYFIHLFNTQNGFRKTQKIMLAKP